MKSRSFSTTPNSARLPIRPRLKAQFPTLLKRRAAFIEPILKTGQRAPVLQATRWLDRDGLTNPPDFAGKVMLIDFWAITRGPCLATLPTDQESKLRQNRA